MVGRLGAPNAGRVTTSSITAAGNTLWQAVEEAFFLNPFKAEQVADGLQLGDTRATQWYAASTLSEALGFAETDLTFYVTVIDALSDSIGLADSGYEQPAFGVAPQVDIVSFAEDFFITRLYPITAPEVIQLSTAAQLSPAITVLEAANFTAATIATMARTLNEAFRFADNAQGAAYFRLLMAEQGRFRDSLLAAFMVSAVDGLALTDLPSVVRALALMDQLGVSDAPIARALLNLTTSERVRVLDGLYRFFSGDVSDTIGLAPLSASLRRAVTTASEALGLADTATPRAIFRVLGAEGLQLTDAQLLKMVFAPAAADGVEIVGAYISPGGDFTTWAVNTRVGAVTEYTDYTFNSFAKLGTKYIGASDSGLYELAGDTDAGQSIVADIKGGFLQFNGSRFAGMKAVYLGIRGGGEFFLKLVAASGETYTYKVVTEDMATTKVWIGKGLRHRYLSYELISTGQDFDLESIEFIPMLAQRRV
jgi:hypothetical protein